jgi:Zn finger protein HypA/HybF involved in hydrogenase expression
LIGRVNDNPFKENHMKPDFEAQVKALLEQMELDAACPDCGKLSLAIWRYIGPCPQCDGKAQAAKQ